MQVHTTANALGNLAAEAQGGLADASLIHQTLARLNSGGMGGQVPSSPGLDSLGEMTKNLVNAAMGKGLGLDTTA